MLRSIVILAVFLAPLPLAAQRDRGSSEEVWKTLSEKYDANEDGRIDAQEYPRGERKFRGLDRNRDGALSAADFESRGRRRGGLDFSRMMSGRVVGAADGDGSGDVTKDEWKAFLASLDADEEGVINEEKLRAMFSGRGGGPDRGDRPGGDRPDRGDRPERGRRGPDGFAGFGRRMIEMMDRDEDGNVEIADLEVIFAEVDRDQSGVIESSEMRSRGGARRGGDSDVPQAGDVAPDFELAYAKNAKETVRLSSFAGKRPVALVFGSYT